MTTTNLTSILAESGRRKIGLTALAMMSHCATHEGVSLTKLAAILGRSNANITTAADKLQERDLIRRRSIPGDRRLWSLALTKLGKETIEAITNQTALK